jgi:stearoyl-CoA desaturase (delta-9 desaturase)
VNEKYFNPIYKNILTVPNLGLVVIPILVFGIYALTQLIINFEFLNLSYFLLGYFLFMIVGVTTGYHRYFSHKSFVINKTWKKKILMICGALSGQGSPIFWVTVHRGYHHRKSDQEEDFHSPRYGFWHATLLWMFRIKPGAVSPKYSLDLVRDPFAVWIHENYVKLFLGFNIILAIIDINLFLYFSMLACFITLFSYNLTNSVNHIKSLGYRNYDTKDNSVNVPWIWPIVFGECWHNNHHGKPGDWNFGKKWWELDPSAMFIRIFRDEEATNRA